MATIIDSVVRQLQQERARLEGELSRVTAALNSFGKASAQKREPAAGATPTGRGRMSAAGRRKIAAAQRARWAKIKAAKG